MIYNYINGKIIIAKMYDEFNIKSRDWENRTPKWIADAMKHLNINVSWEEVGERIEFDNYHFELPVNVRLIRGIIINGIKCNRVTTVSHIINNTELDKYSNDNYNYSLSNNAVNVEIKSGTAVIVYKRLPLDWDDILGMWIPKLPDVPQVIDNIGWYVLKIILARGYQHPIYSLTSNRAELNPDYLWKSGLKAARMSAKRMDNEDRRILAETLSNFLVNPHSHIDDLFSKSAKYYKEGNDFIQYWHTLTRPQYEGSIVTWSQISW